MSDAIVMPIAEAIRRAHAQADAGEVVRLVEAAPIEAWFGIPPDELRGILSAVPEEAYDRAGLGWAFRASLSPEVGEGSLPEGLGGAAFAVLGARLRGLPVLAATIMDGIELTGDVHPLFDRDGGLTTAVWLHRGLTYMLAGRLSEARDCFATATVTPPPAALTMLLRDSYVKAAVLHALFGSPREARRQLDIATTLPLTTSWAEPIVSTHQEVAEALLAEDDALDAAIERLERLPAFAVGELWPFWLLAVLQLHVRAGRVAEGVARVEFLSVGLAGVSDGEGYPGSVLPVARALGALLVGDAEAAGVAIAGADPDLAITRLLVAALARPGDESHEVESPELEQLAESWLKLGDESTAQRLLRGFVARGGHALTAPEAAHAEAVPGDHVPGRSRTRAPVRRAGEPSLSRRELQVLQLLASERTREQIAAELFVSVNTIKSQLRSIFRKLGVDNRLDAVLEAEKHRLLR